MAFGKKEEASDESGQYLVESSLAFTPKQLAKKLNDAWNRGWRFVRMDEVGPVWMMIYERRL